MTRWNVTFTYVGDPREDAVVAVEDALGDDATIAVGASGQFTLGVWVDSGGPVLAAEKVAGLLWESAADEQLGLPRLLGVEVLEESEYVRRASLVTIPELVGATEASEILGISRQRVRQLYADNSRFPAPVAQVKMGPLWARSAIEAFDRHWERRPGRPARVFVVTAGKGETSPPPPRHPL